MALIVLDDVLPTLSPELTDLVDEGLDDICWYNINQEHLHKDFCLYILDIARKYFDLSNAVGYEFWDKREDVGWHYDKDEELFHSHGKLVFPICSTIYYLKVDKVTGGQLAIESDIITPKTNRLVMFSPGQFHRVNPYKGKRVSLLINPWSHPLCN